MSVQALTPTPSRPRMSPYAQELTGSWIRRMTAHYGLPAQDLLRGILAGPRRVRVRGTPRSGLELFLNAPAREELTRFTGLPLARLTGLLPSLATHELFWDDEVAGAAWGVPRQAWVSACPACTPRACSPGRVVLVYPGAAGHICRRHQRWLLAQADKPAGIPLQTLPEILAAHRRHTALLRTHPGASNAMIFAAAMVWSWQVRGWRLETIWQDRVHRLTAVTRCTPAAVTAHALLSYPETVAIARLLVDGRWQQRLRETMAGAGVPSATGKFLQEVGRRINRPWLADWLAAHSRTSPPRALQDDPLRQWLHELAMAERAGGTAGWTVLPSALRPAEFIERAGLLTPGRARTVFEEAAAASLIGGWEPATAQVPLRAR
ncbi:TniQ family protein [Streptomyces sp. NPDC102476]|uniref:TniQ family protein n=1 Tax=Streptomyces sp. NPDC102476 TaxID=3366181 RepID=UPI00380E78F6